jgi:hypothetical protein
MGNFGVLVPVWVGNAIFVRGNNFDSIANFPYGYAGAGDKFHFVQYYESNTYDLFMPAGDPVRKPLNFLVDIKTEPVTLSFATGGLSERQTIPSKVPWGASQDNLMSNYHDINNPPLERGGANYAFRAEGAEIAGLLNIGAVYKYNSVFISKEYIDKTAAGYTGDQIDEHIEDYAYGLYLNLTLPIDLGLSVGYSGQLHTYRNERYENTKPPVQNADQYFYILYKEAKFPLYHGIDLRMCYTGVDKLTVTFNNNLTFAGIKGLSKEEVDGMLYAEGWAYTNLLQERRINKNGVEIDGSKRSEDYLGLFNALSVRYAISGSLLAEVSAASQLGLFTLTWEEEPVQSIFHYMGLYAGVTYSVIKKPGIKGSIRGGFTLRVANYTNQLTTGDFLTAKAGFYEIGVPLAVMVEF